MNIYDKSKNILGQYSSSAAELKLDVHLSEMNKSPYEKGGPQPQMPLTEKESMNAEMAEITLTSDFGRNDEYNYEQACKLKSSNNYDDDGDLRANEDENLNKTFTAEPQNMREELSEIGEQVQKPENTDITVGGAIVMQVKEEKFVRNDASDEVTHGTTAREQGQYREVSVQTTEEKIFISNVSTCPICKLEDVDLKDKLIDCCLQLPPYKKRKMMESESSTKDDTRVDETCEGSEKGDHEDKLGFPDAQIVSKQVSSFHNIEGGNVDFKEFSCRTIRVGLSRRVKLPHLHQISALSKKHMFDSG